MKEYDIILIGTGQATGIILPQLLKEKLSVAVIEEDRTGGTCVNWGCTPTKTFIASARAAHMVRRGTEFGIDVDFRGVQFSRVMERVNAIRNGNSKGFTTWLEKVTDFYRGTASFSGTHEVMINSDTIIKGREIIIHTGTRSRLPQIPGIDSISVLDNKGILALEELPSHLVILGGSYIGIEFAQAYRRLGSEVTIIEYGDRLVAREDADVSQEVREILESDGIRVVTEAGVVSILETGDGQIELAVNHQEGFETIQGSKVLAATGRIPNTDKLNLESAGVLTDERGFVIVDDQGRTSQHHIFALGDVNGRGAFTHTSVHDGQVYLSQRAGGNRKISQRTITYSLFMDPPLARAGLSENQAAKAGVPYLVAKRSMESISRAREKDETRGFIKLLVHRDTKVVLGAAILGIGGDEIIGMLSMAIQKQMKYGEIQDIIIPHPTVSELIPWIFNELKAPDPQPK